MSKKSPAFQFYVDDFTGSGTVRGASAEEVGVYALLMCHDWSEVGFVFDEERLARIAHVPLPRFRRAWAHLEAKFPERDGRRYNPRLEEERRKQAEWAARASDKGRKGASARWPGQCPDDATGIGQASEKGSFSMPGDGSSVFRLPVTASSLLAEFPDKAHRDAVETALQGQHPSAVEYTIRGLHDGTTRAYPYPVIGRALLELQAAGTTFSAKALDAFCRRIQAGDPPPRQPRGGDARSAPPERVKPITDQLPPREPTPEEHLAHLERLAAAQAERATQPRRRGNIGAIPLPERTAA